MKKTFVVYLVSYVIMLFLPLALGSMAYFKAGQAVEEEALRANMAMLEQARDAIDKQLVQVTQLTNEIALNPRINELIYLYAPLDEKARFGVYYILRDLSMYKSMHPFIDDFYIFFTRNNTVITSTGKYDADLFYKYIYNYENMDYKSWYSLMTDYYSNSEYKYSQLIRATLSLHRMITYMQSLPINERDRSLAKIVVMIDESKFKELLSSLQGFNQGNIYIVDENGKIVFSVGDSTDLPSSVIGRLNNDSGWFHDNVNDIPSVVSYISSQRQQWKYVFVMPTKIFSSKVIYIKNLTITIMAICMGFGLFLALLLAKRNYTPIKSMVNALLAVKGQNPIVQPSNEMDYIQKTVFETLQEEKKVKGFLDEQKPVIQTNLLMRLLEGRMHDSSILGDSMKAFDIEFPFHQFIVMAFRVDSYTRLKDNCTEQQLVSIQSVLTNAINEMIMPNGRCYIAEKASDQLVLLINFNDNFLDINAVAFAVRNCIEYKFDLSCTVGIGSIYKGINNVAKSYSEAVRALDYSIIRGRGCTVHYGEITNTDQRYYYPLEIERQLINYVKAGDFKGASKLIEYIFNENMTKRDLSLRMAQLLFSVLIDTVIKLMDEMKVNYMAVFGYDPVDCISFTDATADEVFKWLSRTLEILCHYAETNKRSHNIKLIKNIIDYINNQYGDHSICLVNIADVFHITPQYLSKFFKEQTGENIMDYIAKLRINKAKELLRDQTLTIEEVARRVGYNNDIALIRAFKKYIGITPGIYRDNSVQDV